MRYWFDTEFIDDGKNLELVSIGIISENNRTYYAEVADADVSKGDAWFQKNVTPYLTGERKTRQQIAEDLVKFCGKRPEFWAYYASWDWMLLCRLYGRMIDGPAGWPHYVHDLRTLADYYGAPPLLEQKSIKHNALNDAIWTRDAWYDLVNRHAIFEH